MTFFETIGSALINAIITGFGVAIGSYLATNHLIEKLKTKEEKK